MRFDSELWLTGAGVYKDLWPYDPVLLDMSHVQELHTIRHTSDGVTLGAGVTLTQLIDVLSNQDGHMPESSREVYDVMAAMVHRVAGAGRWD